MTFRRSNANASSQPEIRVAGASAERRCIRQLASEANGREGQTVCRALVSRCATPGQCADLDMNSRTGRARHLAPASRISSGDKARLFGFSRSARVLPWNRLWQFVAVCWLVLLSGCAGYQVGHQSLYRPDLRTIYVPMFESDSLRRNLSEALTEAVVKEIESRTPYKVVADPSADSLLTGRIVYDRKQVLAESANDDARNVEVGLVAQITWQDQRGLTIMQTGIPLSTDLLTVSVASNYIPEGGQSLATAQRRAMQKLAEQIVSQMQTPW